ncbi:hypothetical protein TNCV_2034361, partial [Trichonephila clavipes]
MRTQGDGPHHFEPRPNDEDDTRAGTLPLRTFSPHRRVDFEFRQWYWARTHDVPAMIRYLVHWATAVLPPRPNKRERRKA